MPRPWIIRPRPRPGASLRLYCLPFAGGGASAFRTWPAGLPDDYEVCAVQFPGRESRFREAPVANLVQLAEALSAAIGPNLRQPYAVFGHSLGAWVAFELARRLAASGAPAPVRLFLSGSRSPKLPERFPPIHSLPDGQFLDEITRRYGGIPAEISENADLLKLMLPAMRADFRAVETYSYSPGPKLSCPITALGGLEDPFATRDELEAWRDETIGSAEVALLPGGHFFIQTERLRLLQLVSSRLGNALGDKG